MEGLRFVRKIGKFVSNIRKILFENPVNTQLSVSNKKLVFIDFFLTVMRC